MIRALAIVVALSGLVTIALTMGALPQAVTPPDAGLAISATNGATHDVYLVDARAHIALNLAAAAVFGACQIALAIWAFRHPAARRPA